MSYEACPRIANKVAEVRPNICDATHENILEVYSRIGDVFAVYRNAKRVMIQYADDKALGQEQRRALSALNPIRGEINGLVDGWRSGSPRDRCRAEWFDRRTADALTVALQGDQLHAEGLLKTVKKEVLAERRSIARQGYLLTAIGCTAVIGVLFWLLAMARRRGLDTFTLAETVRDKHFWLAATMGSLGALFSIALAIRSREIRTDLQARDNVVDALLRVFIGALSAIVLFSLLRSGLISVSFGGGAIQLGSNLDVAIVIAFLAGFSERLVGDYLSRATVSDGTTQGATAAPSPGAQSLAKTEVDANERNPRGRSEIEIAQRSAPPAAAGGGASGNEHADEIDGCLCGLTIDVEEVTSDEELPEATGGVERV